MSERDYRETTDSEDVRKWANQQDVVPARSSNTGELTFIKERGDQAGASAEKITWDEFDDEFERRGATFRYEDEVTADETGYYEFVDEREGEQTDDDRVNLSTDDPEEGTPRPSDQNAPNEQTPPEVVDDEMDDPER